jgi:outer membrane protein TolC
LSVSLGKKAKIDILKADNQLQEAKGEFSKIKNSLKLIKSTLKIITYSDIDYFEQIDVDIDNYKIEDSDLDSLDRFKIEDLEIEKSSRVISKIKSQKRPQVKLNSYLGDNYSISDRERVWQIGVNIKWNIFDFGTNLASIEEAKVAKLKRVSQKEITIEGFKKLLATAQKKIEDATINYRTNLSRLNLLQETQKIEEARYSVGVATLNELLLAKAKTKLTKSKLIESKYAYKNGLYYLEYLLEQGENR